MHERNEKIIALLYELASLDGRLEAGLSITDTETYRLEMLRAQFEHDHYRKKRRMYLRLPLQVSAVLNHQGKHAPIKLHNMSASGCMLETSQIIVPNDRVELRLGLVSHNLYLFSGLVRRIQYLGKSSWVALEFDGIPLHLRAYRVQPLRSLRVPGRRPLHPAQLMASTLAAS
ncbi:MAG: PilZ domain-containing protein [Deltaproteobacteria bacterium]|nr:PilZ domain-containing protein [Deltaproteobacteria bacterium]